MHFRILLTELLYKNARGAHYLLIAVSLVKLNIGNMATRVVFLTPSERAPFKNQKEKSLTWEECANCASSYSNHGVTLKQCSRCKLLSYCSKECQDQHWRKGGHKFFCLPPSERRASSMPAISKPLTDSPEKEAQCLVCRERILSDPDSTRCTLPCSHSYHFECVKRLVQNSNRTECPACRKSLRTMPCILFFEGNKRFIILREEAKNKDGKWDGASWKGLYKLHPLNEEETNEAAELMHVLEDSANSGHVKAQELLGEMYYYSFPCPVKEDNAMKAIYWLEKAAHQGSVSSHYILGHAYLKGKGVLKSSLRAETHWLLVSKQGDVNAHAALGHLYSGYYDNDFKDYAKSAHFFLLASKLSHTESQCEYGVAAYRGLGLPKSHAAAAFWIRKSADCDY